jgi:hypothetical protein
MPTVKCRTNSVNIRSPSPPQEISCRPSWSRKVANMSMFVLPIRAMGTGNGKLQGGPRRCLDRVHGPCKGLLDIVRMAIGLNLFTCSRIAASAALQRDRNPARPQLLCTANFRARQCSGTGPSHVGSRIILRVVGLPKQPIRCGLLFSGLHQGCHQSQRARGS